MKEKKQRSRKGLNGLTAAHAINAGVFIIVVAVMGVASLALPKPTVSEYEKRELEKMPEFSLESLFKGEYSKKLDLFFADTFPAREKFVEMAARQEEYRGMRVDDVKIHGTVPVPAPAEPVPEEKPEPTPPPADNTPEPPAVPEPEKNPAPPEEDNVEGERRGSAFVYKDMALPLFGSNFPACDWYAQTLNSYHEQLGDDVTIYNLVIPSSIEFYLPEKYKGKGLSSDEKENIDYIYSKMGPDIKTVDAYSEMDKAKDQYIYFRTDHHWTVRGAYAAYIAFCREAGFTPVPLEKMERHVIENFVGTLYGQTQDIKLKEHPDFVEYFIPPVETETYRYVKNQPYTPYASTIFADYATSGPNTYSVFLHGDFPLTHIKTNAGTGRKIAVVKESFGNAFSPFLVSHYDEVFVVDQRYYQLGLVDLLRQNDVHELLFINNIFAANTEIRISELNRIMYQQFVPPEPEPEEEEGEEEEEDSKDKDRDEDEDRDSKKDKDKHKDKDKDKHKDKDKNKDKKDRE